MTPAQLVAILTGADFTYPRARDNARRHFRINRIRTAEEVGAWCVERTGSPNAPAIYESKDGILCVSCETDTLHGRRVIKSDHCEHRTLHVERIDLR